MDAQQRSAAELENKSEAIARESEPVPQWLDLFATGSNSHQQLAENDYANFHTFRRIFAQRPAENFNVIFAGWSTTVLTSKDYGGPTILGLGHQRFMVSSQWQAPKGVEAPASIHPVVAFGSHEGLFGFIDIEGRLVVAVQQYHDVEKEPQWRGQDTVFSLMDSEVCPSLSLVAIAGNDRVACTFRQAPNGRLCHVVEFETPQKFMDWIQDPSGDGKYPDHHHILPGRPKQLLANTATFLLLMENGEVYSWGDPRYRSLGRRITGEGATPAAKLGLVEAVGGLHIRKIVSGGWLSAALSDSGTLYLWGAGTPGAEKQLRCLQDVEPGEVSLVSITDTHGSEPLDILDVAIGDAHVAVVTEGNRLFVVGDNVHGQLGFDHIHLGRQPYYEDWAEVSYLHDVQRVVCAPKATFAFVSVTEEPA